MNTTMFQFGAGSRTCIGKNLSLMEIYKLVPSFLRRFEVRFLTLGHGDTSEGSNVLHLLTFDRTRSTDRSSGSR